MTARIVVVGSFNMDLTTYVQRMPRPGETVMGDRFVTGPGGKGSNQAIAAARLGAEVTFVGRVGQDSFGETALKMWRDNGVDTRYVVVDPDRATGVAPILVEAGGENMIVVALGANLALSTADVDAAIEAIKSADMLVTGLEIPPATAAYALTVAKANGVRTILNPAPASALPDTTVADADYLTPNETELEVLTGLGTGVVERAARMLFKRPDQTVIVTMGGAGTRYFTANEEGHVPVFQVDVVDTTGAGDSFTAAVAVALGEGLALPDAVRFGNAAAALCVTKPGTASSMPYRAEVDTLLKA
ncbi:MAG: ribokinase [Chloroflexi bacterium]|nr:ribokinase [Chloroflexota bacterium]